MSFACVIPGNPRGKGSVRVGRWGAYKDDKTENYMATCILSMRAEHVGPPIEEPTRVTIAAYLPRPATLIPKAKGRVEQPPAAAFLAPVKPDLDNLSKAICDALTQAGVIVDDQRVVELRMSKSYVPVGIAPYVAVRVEVAPRWDGEAGWWAR